MVEIRIAVEDTAHGWLEANGVESATLSLGHRAYALRTSAPLAVSS